MAYFSMCVVSSHLKYAKYTQLKKRKLNSWIIFAFTEIGTP